MSICSLLDHRFTCVVELLWLRYLTYAERKTSCLSLHNLSPGEHLKGIVLDDSESPIFPKDTSHPFHLSPLWQIYFPPPLSQFLFFLNCPAAASPKKLKSMLQTFWNFQFQCWILPNILFVVIMLLSSFNTPLSLFSNITWDWADIFSYHFPIFLPIVKTTQHIYIYISCCIQMHLLSTPISSIYSRAPGSLSANATV